MWNDPYGLVIVVFDSFVVAVFLLELVLFQRVPLPLTFGQSVVACSLLEECF